MPVAPVYRIVRTERDPFVAPPAAFSGHSRFDCPFGTFQVLYAASTPAAAYGELLAQHRPKLSALARLGSIAEVPTSEIETRFRSQGLSPLPDNVVRSTWFSARHIGWTTVDTSLQFVDLVHPDTIQALRPTLASFLTSRQISDLDMAALFSADRAITQQISSHLHGRSDADGQPLVAGIRYPSRLHLGWECWALFADRLRHGPVHTSAVQPDDPSLQEACRVLDLRIGTAD